MFIGFVVAYGGFIWFLLTPKHFEIQCFGLIFSTANQWEVTKTTLFIFPPLLQISEPNVVCT